MQFLRFIFCLGVLASSVKAEIGVFAEDGRQAWVVQYEQGRGVVSQIWVKEGGTNRVLGVVPGRVEGLGWLENKRLILDVAETNLPLYGAPNQEIWTLVPKKRWIIGWDGYCEEVRSTSEKQRVLPNVSVVSNTVPKEVKDILDAVAEAMHSATMAYAYLHKWDFRNAESRYEKAGEKVDPDAFSGSEILEPLFLTLSDVFVKLENEVRDEGSRRVCRDHLEAIGQWLISYQMAHASFLPEDLTTLRAWVNKHGALDDLFRCAIDPNAQNTISYIYRADARVGEAVLISPFYRGRIVELLRQEEGYVVQDRAIEHVQIDSLMTVGQACEITEEAIDVFEMVTHIDPKSAEGFVKLGYARLDAGLISEAKNAFEKAIDLNHRLSRAYNGLGRVYEHHPKGRYDAIRYFRKALQYDDGYVEARYNMARVRFELKEYDAKRDLDRVIEEDDHFAPAFLLLGSWYEELEEDYANAAVAYARYLALRPDDSEGRRRLAATYVRTQDFDKVTALLEDYARTNPDEIDILPILALACMEQDRLDWAQAYFGTYVTNAPDSLKNLYEDIQFVASTEELAELQSLNREDEARFLREFWSVRDPNLTTAANERQLEHYRRVWYALMNFSGGKKPWDRRGEVYIRFGEPDYRSRSDLVNMKQNLAVQRVKDRMAQTLYGLEATQLSYFGPVYPVRGLQTSLSGVPDMRGDIPKAAMQNIMQSREQARETQMGAEESRSVASTQTTGDDQTGFSEAAMDRIASMDVVTNDGPSNGAIEMMIGGGRYASNPLAFRSRFQGVGVGEDASMVRWESWVYTDIGGGIEITFTDEAMVGNYDYAPSPLDANIPIRKLALFNRYNPKSVTELASKLVPDYYVTPDNQAPLEFYYDVVDFRSIQKDQGALEVYTGIPREIGRYLVDEDATHLVVERVVALLNEETGDVYRRSGQVRFAGHGNLSQSVGAFVPDVVRIDAPPGSYRLEVALHDRMSGRQGRYRQDVVIEDYYDAGLQVSDLVLAWQVRLDGPQDKFRKGDLHVVPMPTRTYAQDQNIYVYYEIYNLTKDRFGQSNYQVEYTVGAKDDGLGGVISSLVKVFAGEKNQVAVGYEQVGMKDAEAVYTELDLGAYQPGRYSLKVIVTDLNSGKKTEKEAFFVVAK